ncbi:cytochrome P450 [Nocardia sp. NPDC048505]|uniref:cytochrome P450 family protein n=1 Tax=Nocardia sp. NPDC048505 TaxID=3155756 RepID=UPI003410137E
MDEYADTIVLDPTGADIAAEAARIRARGPLSVVELPGGIKAWSVTDYNLARRLLSDALVSKDPRRHWPAFQAGEIGPDWPLFLWVGVDNMFTAYGPEHRRLRKILTPAFSPGRVEALGPRISGITADLLTGLAETPAGQSVDLREHFAYPLPIRVIAELMGVPEDLDTDLRRAVDGLFTTAATPAQAEADVALMYATLGKLVDYRRTNPGEEDLTRLLIEHCDPADPDSPLTEQNLLDTLLMVISAGHETTVNLLDQAVFALLTHPEHYEAVCAGRASWDDVIEETLRWRASVAHVPLRYAVDDIAVDGITIAAGDPILISYAAIGGNPRTFGDDADQFDILRENKAHLSFGFGIHKCLGAALARREARIALPALFERFPLMSLAADPDDLETIDSFISYGHRRLPVYLA